MYKYDICVAAALVALFRATLAVLLPLDLGRVVATAAAIVRIPITVIFAAV